MRHRSSANLDPTLPEWPSQKNDSSVKRNDPFFQDELEHNSEGMAFEPTSPGAKRSFVAKFGKEDDQDSLVSGHSASRLQKKTNLELVWQKANSINGIRKLNMMFKEERRAV